MPDLASQPRSIVVFGDIIDDVVAVPRGPIRTDTDTVSSIRFRPGGSAANTASWLGSLGAPVHFIGTVGVDDAARHTLDLMDHGVWPHLAGHPTLPTGAIVVIVEGETRTMLTERGANAVLDTDLVTDEMLAGAGILHLTGHTLFGMDEPTRFTALIARALAAGVEVCVDPGSAGYIADFGVDQALGYIAGASILVPNLEEGRALTGLVEPLAVASSLAERFAVVALTLDTNGVIVARAGHEPVVVEAVRTTVADPTGAGDAFTAGFLHEWLATRDADAAARAGVALASRAVSTIGARPPR
jgi:sugar/nucleoside kinase (ribokinase family)